MIRFAHDRVSPHGVQPEIVLALLMADRVFAAFGQDCLITSLTDGVHSAATRHRQGLAVDLRSKTIPEDQKAHFIEGLRDALPPYYEVYLEDPGGENEHVHIEYDWKGAP